MIVPHVGHIMSHDSEALQPSLFATFELQTRSVSQFVHVASFNLLVGMFAGDHLRLILKLTSLTGLAATCVVSILLPEGLAVGSGVDGTNMGWTGPV